MKRNRDDDHPKPPPSHPRRPPSSPVVYRGGVPQQQRPPQQGWWLPPAAVDPSSPVPVPPRVVVDSTIEYQFFPGAEPSDEIKRRLTDQKSRGGLLPKQPSNLPPPPAPAAPSSLHNLQPLVIVVDDIVEYQFFPGSKPSDEVQRRLIEQRRRKQPPLPQGQRRSPLPTVSSNSENEPRTSGKEPPATVNKDDNPSLPPPLNLVLQLQPPGHQ